MVMILLKRGYIYMISLAILSSILIVLAGCGNKTKSSGTEEKKLTGTIEVTTIQSALSDQYYETSGTLKANTVSKIAPKVMGEVTSVYVKAGDRVQAGQVLAELTDSNIQQKSAAADAGRREAEKGMQLAERNRTLQTKTYERYEQLYHQAAISRQQLDEIRTQYEMAQLTYEQAEAAMDKATAVLADVQTSSCLLAPISGIVTEKSLEIGSMVQPGITVITVEDTQSFLIECYVESALALKIHTNMDVLVDLEDGKTVTAKVSEVVPSIDPASRSFLVKVSLADATLKTGQYSKVRFPIGKQPMLQVPTTAIVNKGQLTGVYVLDETKRVWYRLVKTGRQYDGKAEIISGLKGGETVVVNGLKDAIDGAIAEEVTQL
jgi:RND family efflux transporter MFP subunit